MVQELALPRLLAVDTVAVTRVDGTDPVGTADRVLAIEVNVPYRSLSAVAI